MAIKKRRVVLIGFDHKEWAFGEACGPLKISRDTSDKIAWVESSTFENPSNHAGGGGFTMGPGHRDDPLVFENETAKEFGA